MEKRFGITKQILTMFLLLINVVTYAGETFINNTNKQIKLNLNGNQLNISLAYIPNADLGWYTDGGKTDALRLSATWPTMVAFISNKNVKPSYDRYLNEIAILIDPSGNNSKIRQYHFLKFIATDWIKNMQKTNGAFGLQHFIHKDIQSLFKKNGSARFGYYRAQEAYLYPTLNKATTFITCTTSYIPEPGTLAAEKRKTKIGFLYVPSCEQQFFIKGMKNIRVTINYRRLYLKDWKQIQQKVSELIQSFVVKNPE